MAVGRPAEEPFELAAIEVSQLDWTAWEEVVPLVEPSLLSAEELLLGVLLMVVRSVVIVPEAEQSEAFTIVQQPQD